MNLTVIGMSSSFRAAVVRSARSLGHTVVASVMRLGEDGRGLRGVDVVCAYRQSRVEVNQIHTSTDPVVALLLVDCDFTEFLRSTGASGFSDRVVCTLGWDWSESDIVLGLNALEAGLCLYDPTVTSDARRVETVDATDGNGETLTPQELAVLSQLQRGRSNNEIAQNLGITVNTVKFHLRGLFGKLDVHTRSEAVYVATQRGLLAQ